MGEGAGIEEVYRVVDLSNVTYAHGKAITNPGKKNHTERRNTCEAMQAVGKRRRGEIYEGKESKAINTKRLSYERNESPNHPLYTDDSWKENALRMYTQSGSERVPMK